MPRTLAHAPIMILNGPNLNLLGQRQPEIYGSDTLADVEALCAKAAAAHGGTVDFRQSNHEGELVDWIQEAREKAAALVLNPAGYGHTSIAILDALKVLAIPIVLAWTRRLWRKGPSTMALPGELTDRVGSLERSVDSVAVEVERIGEGQRFVTQLLAERAATAGRLAAAGDDRQV